MKYTTQPDWVNPPKIIRPSAEELRVTRMSCQAYARQYAIAQEKKAAENRANNSANKIYIGERGGRYYKRTRADGTTYRDYTW